MAPKKKTMASRFKGIDIFGSPVKLTYQGAFAYTSHFGAAGTLAMYIMLLGYAISGLIRVINNDAKAINNLDVKLDMNDYEGFSPGNATYMK